MIRFDKPQHADAETLHAEVDALALGPYRIEWHVDELVFVFDRELSSSELSSLGDVVEDHDGSAALASRELKEKRIAAIREANAKLVKSAREKRLAGKELSSQELAAMADLMLFNG